MTGEEIFEARIHRALVLIEQTEERFQIMGTAEPRMAGFARMQNRQVRTVLMGAEDHLLRKEYELPAMAPNA